MPIVGLAPVSPRGEICKVRHCAQTRIVNAFTHLSQRAFDLVSYLRWYALFRAAT